MPSGEDGDLAFYVPALGERTDEAVAALTGGPYCHVGVYDNGFIFSAQRIGVIKQRDNFPPPAAILHTGAHNLHNADALLWLAAQVGKPYSYTAVADAAMARVWSLFQPSITWGPFHVAVPLPNFSSVLGTHSFDCSSLAARFLIRAGCNVLPVEISQNPDIATPNSLYHDLAGRV